MVTDGRSATRLLSLSSTLDSSRLGRFPKFLPAHIVVRNNGNLGIVFGPLKRGYADKSYTKVVHVSDKRKLGKLNYELGHHMEEQVLRQLRAWGFVAKLAPPDAPYDFTLNGCYIEVKTGFNGRERVTEAFRRPHPEPFLVILVDLREGRMWVYTSPDRRRKFTKRNLRLILRELGVV